MGAKPSKPSPKDRIDNAQRRMAQEMELDLTKWNWAVIGQTKAGKSSIVNAVQGMKDNDPAHTFSEPDLMVIKRAREYNIPVALVRTMSDVHIGNLMHSEELSMDEAERKLRREARNNMRINLDRADFNHLYPEFFIVSSRVLYCHISGKGVQPGCVEMDEQSLLQWLCKELKKRETS
ncbi:MAG: hypothetical protein FRX49_11516 [Trebouxia sp. A1-2]|nr:MAG: hypothetical protein FRX49_13612 [Trebouxia sp. A1-2]KAA6418571.1 MAG: hypothetical protein FRX49_11516 [Trebouxia sp. A1-2]